MSAYLLKMKSFADSLDIVGSLISVEVLMVKCLIGLEVKYLPITAVLQQQHNLSWQEFQAILLNFQSTLDRYQNGQGINKLSIQYSFQSTNFAEMKNGNIRFGGKSSTGTQ
ncbi:hypothetical protein Scep_026104 [Stephania cephalantha]|uniref:Uncharacterized protein n=1 Tax=Stephania cephalantha TaxID=152367 RepID=A0AAP0HT15_9MAGN